MEGLLSPSEVASLAAILPGLARLIARGSPPSDASLEILLIGAGIDPSKLAIAEATRWQRVLEKVHASGDQDMRAVAMEALTLRGMPAPIVNEALELLSSSVSSPRPAGQPIRAGLASPSARSTTAGTADPIVVKADDAKEISLAVAIDLATSQGRPIQLEAGRYLLSESAALVKPIAISGAGIDRTEILCDGDAGFITVLPDDIAPESAPPFRIENLSLTSRAGTGMGVGVDSGAVLLQTCRLRGWESGVVLGHLDQPTCDRSDVLESHISRCEIVENVVGIMVGGDSAVEVRETLISCSRDSGLMSAGHVSVLSSQILDNRMNGLAAFRNADMAVTDSTSSGNQGHGIVYGDSARGRVQGCTCGRNSVAGIMLKDRVQCSMQGNRCEENSAGIVLTDSARGEVRNNTVVGSEKYNIFLDGQADAIVEENTSEGSGAGILLNGSGAGVVRNNRCRQNSMGIYVDGERRPIVDSNQVTENKHSGVIYLGSTSGTFRHNRCEGNGGNGVVVKVNASPDVENNTIEANAEAGILYEDNASGMATSNTCSDNGAAGIAVRSKARPDLRGNQCLRNGEYGILLRDDALPSLADNSLTGNRPDEMGDLRRSALSTPAADTRPSLDPAVTRAAQQLTDVSDVQVYAGSLYILDGRNKQAFELSAECQVQRVIALGLACVSIRPCPAGIVVGASKSSGRNDLLDLWLLSFDGKVVRHVGGVRATDFAVGRDTITTVGGKELLRFTIEDNGEIRHNTRFNHNAGKWWGRTTKSKGQDWIRCADDKSGSSFVAFRKQLLCVNSSGQLEWSAEIAAEKPLIALGSNGDLSLVDCATRTLFDVRIERGSATQLLGPDHLLTPRAVAVGEDGTTYVADAGRNQLLIVSPDRRHLSVWPGPGEREGATPGTRND